MLLENFILKIEKGVEYYLIYFKICQEYFFVNFFYYYYWICKKNGFNKKDNNMGYFFIFYEVL